MENEIIFPYLGEIEIDSIFYHTFNVETLSGNMYNTFFNLSIKNINKESLFKTQIEFFGNIEKIFNKNKINILLILKEDATIIYYTCLNTSFLIKDSEHLWDFNLVKCCIEKNNSFKTFKGNKNSKIEPFYSFNRKVKIGMLFK